MKQGYFRHPTVHQDRVVFVSEDDLWTIPVRGGMPSRLTSNLSTLEFPRNSPDGSRIAFVAREEGIPEVHLLDTEGGEVSRLTYQGQTKNVACWSLDGQWIYFTTGAGQPMRGHDVLGRVQSPGEANTVETLPYGRASAIAFGPGGGTLLGRNIGDPARWKRYRGGTAGQFWISLEEGASFLPLHANLRGNLASPMWVPDDADRNGRVYFLSDHEGVGNLYSCFPSGFDLKRHSSHTDFYARFASWGLTAEGSVQIVYHAGADLYHYDVRSDSSSRISVSYASPGVQRSRKFVPAASYLEQVALHPEGHSVGLSIRGRAFVMGNHEGAVLQLGQRQGVRYRLPTYLHDGEHLAVITDELGEERLQVFCLTAIGDKDQVNALHEGFNFGRAFALYASPTDKQVALVNHRSELWLYNLVSKEATQVDRSPHGQIEHVAWAPDGRWLAYEYSDSHYTAHVRLYRLTREGSADEKPEANPAIVELTQPVLRDSCPVFDPKGRYLYFLGSRILNPQYDTLKFDLGFAQGMRPYLITLQTDLPNPFVPKVGESEEKEEEEEKKPDKGTGDNSSKSVADSDDLEKKDDKATAGITIAPIEVDLDGIQNRILPFPVPAGIFSDLGATEDRVFWLEHQVQAALPDPYVESTTEGGDLATWVFGQYKKEHIAHGVEGYALSATCKKLIYHAGERLRVVNATVTEESLTEEGLPRVTGWLDLDRIKVSVEPATEWRQMFKEAWRLQRDQFWNEDMSKVDWQSVFERYYPLVDRVGSRSEFSDLMWEMQGELGTSHAYEMGGDYRVHPSYPLGSLGAALQWNRQHQGYEVQNWITGDVWEIGQHSPLAAPGVDVKEGDILIAINGQSLSESVSPATLLVNLAGQEVQLTFQSRVESTQPKGKAAADESESKDEDPKTRHVIVRTLASETSALYRTWVNRNRSRVQKLSEGRLGYLHIPDMGPRGFAEFHRGFLSEIRREGLVVDLRFNGGGHVSDLLLEQLARRRLGFDQTRWQGAIPYPTESVSGPIVALTNEQAGSDGDMFSHAFKLMNLGPLIGKRTWGGVVGIWPRHALVDGTVTTQPEFSIWFKDVGWKVENYGTDPDIEVEITPNDYLQGLDPQLDRSVAECLRLLAENPPLKPNLDGRPDLSLPTLLERNSDSA